jgi:hypothetical protein
MLGPKIYQQQLDELEIDGMEINVSNIQMAMETMNELEEIENILKKIRHNIRTDIRTIRKEYILLINESNLSPEESRNLSPRKVQKKIKKKKDIIKKRNTKIKSYEMIENMVDNYLTQISDAQLYIKNSIQRRVG